jgi:PIN domain nuclease of toxin-antitoxin system
VLNLDTHVLVRAFAGDLNPGEARILATDDWGISAIVLWEVAKLVQLGRLVLDMDEPEVVAALSEVHVWPIDLAVAVTSTRLDFRGDPADELIAATSIVHRVPLVTRDRTIRRSRMVPLASA